jgi:hypothetical protein
MRALLLLLLCVAMGIPAYGQAPGGAGDAVPSVLAEGDALRVAWEQAYANKDYARAAELLDRLCRGSAPTPVDRYNLACLLAKLGKKAEAERALRDALGAGFGDFDLLVQDPDLASLRQTPTYQAVLEGWAELQDATIDGRLAALEKGKPGKHRISKLADLRIALVSATSAKGLAEAEVELRRSAKLWSAWVGVDDGDAQKARPPPWVLLWLPDERDFRSWSAQMFGLKAANIGGLYTRDDLRLVARDTGPTLRHEYWHVLHHRDMSRRNQQHALWVQEGLCSLIEDVDPGTPPTNGGEPVATPALSWRTNMARRMAESGTLAKLGDIMAMDPKRFMGSGSLGRYAQARAFFLYLHQQGKLPAWYAQYVHTYPQDPTGVHATELVLGKPIAQVDRDFRLWLRSLPVVGEAGMEEVALPFDIDEGVGEGVVILPLPLEKSLALGVTAGDLIVAADGKPVRDRHDLAGLLRGKNSGDSITLTLRFRGRDRDRVFKVSAVR